jgi:hypothetical protein
MPELDHQAIRARIAGEDHKPIGRRENRSPCLGSVVDPGV